MTAFRRPRPATARKAFLARHPRLLLWGLVAVVVAVFYPLLGGAVARRVFLARVAAQLGRAATLDRGRAGLGEVVLSGFTLPAREPGRPILASAAKIVVPLRALWSPDAAVEIRGLELDVRRGGEADNVTDLVERLRPRKAGAAGGEAGRSWPRVTVRGGALEADDAARGLHLTVESFDLDLAPGRWFAVQARRVAGAVRLGGGVSEARFGAGAVRVKGDLPLRSAGVPAVEIARGTATPLPTLELTGIEGTVGPAPGGSGSVAVNLRGSYRGARETLWTATGAVSPRARTGSISLRAERFSLDKIAEVLPRSVLDPAAATIDAELTATLAGEAVRFAGELGVAGLTLQHDALAAAPVEDLAFGVRLAGTVYPARRRLELETLEGRLRDLEARLSGSIELAPGQTTFEDGSKLSFLPRIALRLEVPRIPCSKLLASIPAALVPRLKGFELAGSFDADIGARIDYADLDALDLKGRVGIDGCRVLAAPEAMSALSLANSIPHAVEVPKGPGAAGSADDTETMSFTIGPENPDFAPFDQISPYLVNSIMTTEDSGFFKHRGWVASEFKTALRRDLARGGFRLGASSITMQMVKNVLLSQEKTLSRKLQELFLVWYLEQELPKERILEIYLNAIEFGPRVYGIGAASRHYFGKRPSELTPLEAAFFSSILPSPKRRYVQYCHGSLSPAWDKYVRRILARVHERGRLTDAEYASSAAETLVFDRTDAVSEAECMAWVKRITSKPEPDAPPDPEGP